jgi:putative membrane protein
MKKWIMFVAAATISCSQPLLAQQKSTNNEDAKTLEFVKEAATGGMKEVASGKLAESKAKSAEVRSFGARMVRDHSNANAKLESLARAQSITLPPAPAEDPMLKGSNGADFDRNYVQMMVKDHEEDVAHFEKAAKDLPDVQMRNFARQTLPVLKEHLAIIKSIASKMGISTK